METGRIFLDSMLGATWGGEGIPDWNPTPTGISSNPTVPPDETDPNKDECDRLREEMNDLISARRSPGGGEPKGLEQRYDQLAKLAMDQLLGHVIAFQNTQRQLAKLLREFNRRNCPEPPPGVQEWVDKPLPDVVRQRLKLLAKGTGAAIGTGYILYRLIRLLPSLFPPLWETLPANAIAP